MIKELLTRSKQYIIGALTTILIGIFGIEIYLTTVIPEVKNYFFGILESKNEASFMGAIGLYCGLYMLLSLVQGTKGYIYQSLALKIRTIITKLLTKKWVKSTRMTQVDNPAQRINEDARLCTELTISVLSEVLISAFIVVILISQMTQEGMLVLSAIGYTLIGLTITYAYNKRFKQHDINLQTSEATHRTSLAKIALNLGDFTSKQAYLDVVGNYIAYLKIKTSYMLFFRLHGGMAAIVPFLILVPSYFSGNIGFGKLMGGVAQFELIVLNLGIIMNLYTDVIKAQASWERVIKFYRSLI